MPREAADAKRGDVSGRSRLTVRPVVPDVPILKAKVVLLGDSGVGKTSLIKRFVLDTFDDSYVATVGGKVTKKDLVVRTGTARVELNLLIWDLVGREGYTTFQARVIAGARGAILRADRPLLQMSVPLPRLPSTRRHPRPPPLARSARR